MFITNEQQCAEEYIDFINSVNLSNWLNNLYLFFYKNDI